MPDMGKLEDVHLNGKLPVWCSGNAYFDGAKAWKKEEHNLVDNKDGVKVELVEKDGHYSLDTNVYDYLGNFSGDMIDTDTLGKAFEPMEAYENPDGTPIVFDDDYLGGHRGVTVIPGPFASAEDAKKQLF